MLSMFDTLIFGLSGSGKDTAANYLVDTYGYLKTHPLTIYKRFLESYYKLPINALDTSEGKNYIPPGANSSMQEIMVASFFFWKEHDPCFTTRTLDTILQKPCKKVFVGLRNEPEISKILGYCKSNDHYFVAVYLAGRGRKEESDANSYALYRKASESQTCVDSQVFHNVKPLRFLYDFMDSLVFKQTV